MKVLFETTKGNIEIELDTVAAPISCANFVNYVKKGHYTGTIFHRVIPGFMIQGGGFTADMKQKPTDAPIKNEATNGLKNKRGTLSMARTSVVDSATCQFFLNVVDNDFLDFKSPLTAVLRLRRFRQSDLRHGSRRRHREGAPAPMWAATRKCPLSLSPSRLLASSSNTPNPSLPSADLRDYPSQVSLF